MYQVASHAGVIHSQSHALAERSRSAGDPQQSESPFSVLLDEATEGPPVPAKFACEGPQTAQAPLPPEQLTPDQAVALVATPLPESEKGSERVKIAAEVKAAIEIGAVASVDENHSDPADTPDALSTMLALNVASPLPPQQSPAVAIMAAVAPLETQPTSPLSAEQPIVAAASAPQAQAAPAQPLPVDGSSSAPPSQTQPDLAPGTMAPAQTSPELGQDTSASASVSASPTLTEQVPSPQSVAHAADALAPNSVEQNGETQNPAAADTASQPAAEPEPTAGAAAPATNSQPTETAEQTATAGNLQTPGADAPKGAPRSEVAADRSETTGLPNPIGPGAKGLQTAAAAQSSNKGRGANTEPKNAVSAPNTGSAEHEHDDGQPEPTTAGKIEHSGLVSTASRVGMQTAEPAPRPRSEAHAGEAAPVGKGADGAQLINLQAPADHIATPPAPAVQTPSSHGASAAAVPLAGLAIEIAARAKTEGNRFEIRLDPPELGRIDVRLDIDHGGQVTSRLLVDRMETLDALRRDAGDLERALQQAGLKTADNGLQFALRDQSFAGRDHSLPSPGAAQVIVAAPELAAIDAAQTGYGRVLRSGGGIDIRV